ncbi:MAG: hypothetical protein MUF27_03630 [Acidobacteria bacterium]|nr:hypothetical protein [Acidobacteriota bacterium]
MNVAPAAAGESRPVAGPPPSARLTWPEKPTPTIPLDREPQQEKDSTMPLDKKTQDTIEKMRENVNALNAEAERAFAYIREVEAALDDAQPGVEAWRVLSSSDQQELDGDGDETGATISELEYVCYTKRNGRWGLYVVERRERVWPNDAYADDEVLAETDARLLRDADRTTKVRAVPLLPMLVSDLAELVAKATKDAKKVLDRNE